MQGPWVVLALVLVWVVLRFAQRPILAMVFGRQIGERVLAKLPETVHLTRRDDGAWTDAEGARRLWEPLLSHGFADAGTFSVDEMPGVVTRLLASSTDSIMGIVYEHPTAGRWVELVTRYTDGRRCSASNRPDPGVDSPPEMTRLNAVGAPPLKLLDVMRHKRPEGAMVPMVPAEVSRWFEQGYAESMQWRKQNPIRTREVVKVAMKRVA